MLSPTGPAPCSARHGTWSTRWTTWRGGFSGTITVGCFSTLSTLVIPEVADYFAREHPEVQLEFVEGSGPEIQEMLLRGQIDVCFLYEVQRHPEVETVLLAERHFLVALSPEHPLAGREEVSIRELTPHPAALLDVEPASYLNESLLRRFGAEPDVAWRRRSTHDPKLGDRVQAGAVARGRREGLGRLTARRPS